MYTGTSNIAYPTMGGMAATMMQALGSTMYFSAATIDQPGIDRRRRRCTGCGWAEGIVGRGRRLAVRRYQPRGLQAVPGREPRPAACSRAVDARAASWWSSTPAAPRPHVSGGRPPPVRPGEDATLVAGLVHVMLRDGLVDDAVRPRARHRPRGAPRGRWRRSRRRTWPSGRRYAEADLVEAAHVSRGGRPAVVPAAAPA